MVSGYLAGLNLEPHDRPGQQGDQVSEEQTLDGADIQPKRALPKHLITGVVLAGGKARRMHGSDKAWVRFEGTALIEYMLASLREKVAEVFISTSRSTPEYRGLGCRLIADPTPEFEGPLMGILAAMRAAETPWILVVPCDMPLLKSTHLTRLIAKASEGKDLTVAHDGTRIHPLVMCVGTHLAHDLEQFLNGGGRRVEEWIRRQSFSVVDFSDDPEAMANLNSIADLIKMESVRRSLPPDSNSA